MNKHNIIVPSKEEVQKLLQININSKLIKIDTVGELLGMKFVDSLLPKTQIEPEWGFDGLKLFFENHSINPSLSLQEALNKLS